MLSRLGPWLSLFTSSGTLFCCALPSLFVTLGMGATFASFISSFPQVVWLSRYKFSVFCLSGLLLVLVSFIHWLNRNAPCPVDPNLAQACRRTRMHSFWILVFSILVWMMGAFFAFLAPILF